MSGHSSNQCSQPATCGATDLTVHWSGTDGASGIADYTVFVSTDGGAYTPLVTATTDTSVPFTAQIGKTYGFSATARDHAGNVEAPPADADVTHTVVACGTHELAITTFTAPKRVALTAKKPAYLARIAVQIENRSPHPATIADAATLARLVALDVRSLAATCTAPTVTPHAGTPQKKLPVTVKSKKKLKVVFDVMIACASDPAKGTGHEDYRVSARVDRTALGEPDVHPVDDVCPRTVTPPSVVDPYPDGKIHDKGCGTKKADKTLGGAISIDVTVK